MGILDALKATPFVVKAIRLPRVAASSISGASLAVSGLLLQVLFRNPIVGPYILGISSGASLAVSLVIMGGFTFGFRFIPPYIISFSAFLGAAATMAVVLLVASRVKDLVTLLVIGLMVAYTASSVSSFLVALAEKEEVHRFVLWSLGSFSGIKWGEIGVLFTTLAISIPFLIYLIKPLNALHLGEEYARTMGVDVKRARVWIVFVSSALAGAVTSFAGPVAFVGLATPHMARLFFRTSDSKYLIPACLLLGASVTSLCDLLSRTLFSPIELPISATTSLFGAPLVIFLVLKRRALI